MTPRRTLIGVAMAGLAAACSPARLLSGLDRVTGGGAGSRRVASGVPFGSHGQRLDVYAPAGEGPWPVVVFFYGGSWQAGTRGGYAFAGRALAGQGFVTVVPDYRKVPTIRFPAFVEDGAEAVAWTAANIPKFGGEPDTIGVSGHSAGAYIAVLLALDTRYLAAAGAPGAIKAGVGLAGPYDFLPLTGAAIPAMQGADPEETQPIRFARKDAPPLLLVTGTDDTLVRPRNAKRLAARLKELGAPAEFRDYAGLDHSEVVMALSQPFRGKGSVLADMSAFLHTALNR